MGQRIKSGQYFPILSSDPFLTLGLFNYGIIKPILDLFRLP